MAKNQKINVQGTEISVIRLRETEFISLTDMVKGFEDNLTLIERWLRNKNTIEFIGIWEQMHNPDFNSLEFEGIKNEAGTNRFSLSAKKWINKTGAIGIVAKTGRYGGTYAHKDIAFEFGSWLSPEFKLYLITEFQRLKDEENDRLQLTWNLHRTLAKINYRIHTDSIKEQLIPEELPKSKISQIYASEADLLNVAMFGMTAAQWRNINPDLEGNIRDHSTLEQLLVLANLESMNAELIRMGRSQADRLAQLNKVAREQMTSLLNMSSSIKKLH